MSSPWLRASTSFGTEYLRQVGMLPPAYTDLPRFHTQWLVPSGTGFEVVHLDL